MISAATSIYAPPSQWIRYDKTAILDRLVEAKTAAGTLRRLPYLPQWIEEVRQEQLRLEAANLGQHTKEILTEICNYSWEEVIHMKLAEIFN